MEGDFYMRQTGSWWHCTPNGFPISFSFLLELSLKPNKLQLKKIILFPKTNILLSLEDHWLYLWPLQPLRGTVLLLSAASLPPQGQGLSRASVYVGGDLKDL